MSRRLKWSLFRVMVAWLWLASWHPCCCVGDDFSPRDTQPHGEGPPLPADAVRMLQVPPGFQVTLAAAEPDVRQPIAMALDERGRLLVAESYSYDGSTFTAEAHDRILIFEDSNGDGVLDKRRIFCEGLNHLTGLELGFGGVWITAPPHLAFLPDRDRDDRVDGAPEVHLDGWSLKAEHNSVNGLTWGPDGWLYGRHGIKRPSLVGRPGATAARRVSLSCAIWRYHPTRHLFEVVADGTINPWGLDFDEYGQGFLSTSVVDHLWHLVPGAHFERWKDREVHPDPHVYEAMTPTSDHVHWVTHAPAQTAAGTAGGGHSHSDAMVYLGDRWPDEYRGRVFLSNIHGRRINRDRIVRSRGAYVAEHESDFLVSSDPWFRAVTLKYGPDGDLYVSDWSDLGECHDRDGVHRTSGRIYKVSWGPPRLVRVDLHQASLLELVDYQKHRNAWYARVARRVLQERAASGIVMVETHRALFEHFRSESSVVQKLRAMWALHVTGGASSAWLAEQLDHPQEHVRAWAVRLLAETPASLEERRTRLFELAAEEQSWLVRMELTSAIRRLAPERRWEFARILCSSAGGKLEANLERMLWYAVEPAVAAMPERCLRELGPLPRKLRRWVARRAVAVPGDLESKVLRFALQATDSSLQTDLLHGFNQSTSRLESLEPGEQIQAGLEALLSSAAREELATVIQTAAFVGNRGILRQVQRILRNETADPEARRAALAGLVRRRPVGLVEDLKGLIESGDLRREALLAAERIQDPGLIELVVERFDRFAPAEKMAALDLLAARKKSAHHLIDAVEEGLIPAELLQANQLRQMASLQDSKILNRLESVWGAVRQSSAERKAQIRFWTRQLDPARIGNVDLARGRKLFLASCASCHKLFGEGTTLGPDLTGANRANVHYLVSNVIDPSEAVPADYRLTILHTLDGRVITGALVSQEESGIRLQTSTELVTVAGKEIESVKRTTQSVMPDGLLDRLTESEVRDLFGWLMSDGRPSSP